MKAADEAVLAALSAVDAASDHEIGRAVPYGPVAVTRALRRLQAAGLVRAEQTGRRRMYAITDHGRDSAPTAKENA